MSIIETSADGCRGGAELSATRNVVNLTHSALRPDSSKVRMIPRLALIPRYTRHMNLIKDVWEVTLYPLFCLLSLEWNVDSMGDDVESGRWKGCQCMYSSLEFDCPRTSERGPWPVAVEHAEGEANYSPITHLFQLQQAFHSANDRFHILDAISLEDHLRCHTVQIQKP